jgi:microcystin-dependent protein
MQPKGVPMRKTCLHFVLLLTFLATSHAAVTNVAWYRLGENDPGAASGVVVTGSTTNLMGFQNLMAFGGPRYTNRFATAAASQVGSRLSVNFNGTSQYLSNAVISTVVNNFGVEAWVKPNATENGNRTIVYNGVPTANGWGFLQRGGTEYMGSLGGMTAFGSGTASAGTWTHLALVRDNGTTTFYVNGVASGTSLGNPTPATNSFMVGAHPQFVANTWFNGAVDEVRVFTFAAGQFSTNDLLLNVPRVTTLPATALSVGIARLNGSANALGLPTSAWFEWGATTNYGFATAVQSVGAGIVSSNFSQQLTGLVPHGYHYRAVCSNILGVARGSDMAFALTNVTSGSAGDGQPINLGQPALELNFIICTNGNYATSEDSAVPPFIGEVRLFAGNFAPAGWALCHGQLLNYTNYLALYSIVGITFGDDNTNRFALPDLRSRALVTAGEPIGMAEFFMGQRGGATQTLLFPVSIPVHTHPLPPPDGINSGLAGGGAPRNNRSPYTALSTLMYRLGNSPLGTQTVYEPFIGEMTMFAAGHGFPNAALAEGQTFAIAQNTFLYSIIRTSFGGNGTTTFLLPDLRGRVAMGIGQGTGLTGRAFGEMTGVEIPTLTTNQMPSHYHTLPTVPPIVRLTGASGSNQPQTLIQPSLAVKFLISTNGQVPSPSVQATNKMMGQIQLYAGTNVPAGWTLCDGQSLSVATHPALFGVISNFFGGDGATTFALPDLRGRIPVGSPTGQPGATYGVEQFIMTESQLPAHTHSVPSLDFQSWSDVLGLAGTNALFDADADGDGAMNGFEWATGTELTNAASWAPLTIAAADEQAKIRFSRNTNATDVTIHLQRTTALGNSNAWSGLVTNALGAWSSPGIVSESGTNSVKSVEVSDALTNHPAADYRLKVTWP